MDFALSQTQRLYRSQLRDYVADAIIGESIDWDDDNFPHEVWTDLADLGVVGMSIPEAVGVGSTAAGGGVQLLPLMVGEKRARDLLLTGRLLTAEEARRMGLINRVVPDEDVEERTLELVRTIIDEKSPQAYRTIKAIMKGWSNLGLQNQEMARDMTATIWASDEFRERVGEFTGGDALEPREFSGTRPYEE